MTLDVRLGAQPDEVAIEAARFLPRGSRLLDLSEPFGRIAPHMPWGCTLVAPGADEDCDFVIALGRLGAAAEAAQTLTELRAFDLPVIADLPEGDAAPDRLRQEQLRSLLRPAGFARARVEYAQKGMILRLEPSVRAPSAEREVWVLSYSNLGNFGDRLGWHVLSQALPPHARVRRIYHRPWKLPEGRPDLLVLGIGNSLYQPLLTDELFDLLSRAKSSIGIFGTQYREGLDAQRLSAVVDRLDVWWARYEADAYLYGRGRQNVRHLGDWMIDAFPLATPTSDKLLTVGDEMWDNQPLDRTIERIQAHASVASERLHPLLCALTSAEMVAYKEQREEAGGHASGKFRSMLLDIFGHEKPERKLWPVDAKAVAEYKLRVRDNIGELRRDLERLTA